MLIPERVHLNKWSDGRHFGLQICPFYPDPTLVLSPSLYSCTASFSLALRPLLCEKNSFFYFNNIRMVLSLINIIFCNLCLLYIRFIYYIIFENPTMLPAFQSKFMLARPEMLSTSGPHTPTNRKLLWPFLIEVLIYISPVLKID